MERNDRGVIDAGFMWIEEFDELFPPMSGPLTRSGTPKLGLDLFLQLVGMVHVYTERWDTGRVFLTSVAHRAERRGGSATAALATATLAELCWRSGRWDEAWTLATSELVTSVTLTGAQLWLLGFTAHLDAGFGRPACRDRAFRRPRATDGSARRSGVARARPPRARPGHHVWLPCTWIASTPWRRRTGSASRAPWWQADHQEALVRRPVPRSRGRWIASGQPSVRSGRGHWLRRRGVSLLAADTTPRDGSSGRSSTMTVSPHPSNWLARSCAAPNAEWRWARRSHQRPISSRPSRFSIRSEQCRGLRKAVPCAIPSPLAMDRTQRICCHRRNDASPRRSSRG